MRQEASILLLCTEAEAAHASLQGPKLKPLGGSGGTAATLYQICALFVLLKNPLPHILVSLCSIYKGIWWKLQREALYLRSVSLAAAGGR